MQMLFTSSDKLKFLIKKYILGLTKYTLFTEFGIVNAEQCNGILRDLGEDRGLYLPASCAL